MLKNTNYLSELENDCQQIKIIICARMERPYELSMDHINLRTNDLIILQKATSDRNFEFDQQDLADAQILVKMDLIHD